MKLQDFILIRTCNNSMYVLLLCDVHSTNNCRSIWPWVTKSRIKHRATLEDAGLT